jgi:hypothetical protein
LRFIHKWLGVPVFPRENFRIARVEEFTLMYAMVKIDGILLANHSWVKERGSNMHIMGNTYCQWVRTFG